MGEFHSLLTITLLPERIGWELQSLTGYVSSALQRAFHLMVSEGLGSIGTVPQWVFNVGGIDMRINVLPLVMSWLWRKRSHP